MTTIVDSTEILREAPTGTQTYRAFSKDQGLCEGNFQQQHAVPANAWIDLGLEADLSDEETARMFWEAASIHLWLDGEEIQGVKRYTIGPYPFNIEWPQYTMDGYAMRLTLIVPPLDPGDHRVDWRLELEHEVWDRETVYEAGKIWNLTSLLQVGKLS
jgi:hypothetical protein